MTQDRLWADDVAGNYVYRHGMDVIVCEGLTKRYRDTAAVDKLNLVVPPAVVFGFLGPNGAGKTTTIRMLLGLVAPTAGQGWLLGKRIPDPTAVAACGVVFEEPSFYPWMGGRANLEAVAMTTGRPDRSRIAAVLDLVGLGPVAERQVKAYSQGMRQRLGIAAALLCRPPVLVLDEPANGLDPAGIGEVRGLLRDLAADGTTVFLSSHILAEVEQVCDQAAIVVAGRLVEQGPVADLGATRRQVRVMVDPTEMDAATRLLNGWRVRADGSVLVVDHPIGREVNAALAAGGVIVESLSVERQALEERFLELTGSEDHHVVADS
jgi:ABC-2 type transport system ATP-binding protein